MLIKENTNLHKAEFDNFSDDYNNYMHHPLRDLASGQNDLIFPEHKSNYLIRLIKQILENKQNLNILDFGCGNGSLLKCLSKKLSSIRPTFTFKTYGIDISQGMIYEAQKFWKNESNIPQFDILFEDKTPYKNDFFDFIIASSVFHHINPAERSATLQEIYRILKPGGYFLMIEHNPLNPITNYIVKRTPMDVNAKLLNPFEAKKLIQFSGFDCVRTDYILFFPPKIKKLWFLERYMRWLIFGGQYISINKKLD